MYVNNTECKLLECKWSVCASGWKELKQPPAQAVAVALPPMHEVFAPLAEGKTLLHLHPGNLHCLVVSGGGT